MAVVTGALAGDNRGKIPFRVRIGVTGHRDLPDPAALTTEVRRVLARITDLFPPTDSTPVVVTAVSPLAEGADRLVAEEVLELPAEMRPELEVALPMPREEYSRDFTSPDGEFRDLHDRATLVWIAPEAVSREERYDRAGRFVVDRSDVVIALWDGQEARGHGGTAQAVTYAAKQRVPVFWIDTDTYEIREQRHDAGPQTLGETIAHAFVANEGATRLDRAREAFARLDEYNGLRVSEPDFRREYDTNAAEFVSSDRPRLRARLQALASWGLPGFVRADLLARRYRQTYNWLSDLLLLLSSFAVTTAAAQVIFLPESNVLVWVEVLLLVSLLAIVLVGRWRRFHSRWISYRSLAEAFRSALFLASTGVGAARQELRLGAGGTSDSDRLPRSELGEPTERWFQRAFSEAWKSRPALEVTNADVPELRRFLSETWIGSQIAWHRKTRTRYRRRHISLTLLMYALFGTTLLFASLHLGHVGESEASGAAELSNWFVFLSIALPAFGAAFTGIREQRQYLLHSERYGHVANRLERVVKERLDTASDLAQLQAAAAESQRVILEENLDWFGVVEFQDLEILT